MRLSPLRSIASWALAWAAVLALVSPGALAQDAEPAEVASAPLAAVSGAEEEEERCELITARRGEAAEIVEEKTRERGEEFPFLASQDGLLEEFRVDEDERRACAGAFGLLSSAGSAAAAGAAAGAGFGATLAGAGVATAVGVGVAAAAIGGVVAATAGPGGGGNNTIPPTTTVPSVGPE